MAGSEAEKFSCMITIDDWLRSFQKAHCVYQNLNTADMHKKRYCCPGFIQHNHQPSMIQDRIYLVCSHTAWYASCIGQTISYSTSVSTAEASRTDVALHQHNPITRKSLIPNPIMPSELAHLSWPGIQWKLEMFSVFARSWTLRIVWKLELFWSAKLCVYLPCSDQQRIFWTTWSDVMTQDWIEVYRRPFASTVLPHLPLGLEPRNVFLCLMKRRLLFCCLRCPNGSQKPQLGLAKSWSMETINQKWGKT